MHSVLLVVHHGHNRNGHGFKSATGGKVKGRAKKKSLDWSFCSSTSVPFRPKNKTTARAGKRTGGSLLLCKHDKEVISFATRRRESMQRPKGRKKMLKPGLMKPKSLGVVD